MRGDGRSRRRHASAFVAACLALAAAPAPARTLQVAIPALPLDQALAMLAAQTGTDIVSTEPGLHRIIARPIARKALSPARALDRLLNGSGYRVVAIDARSFRIVRAAPPLPFARRIPPPAASTPDTPRTDIVVNASKQRVPLLRYPGSIATVDAARTPLSRADAPTDDLVHVLPVLQSTDLGPGRNKLFIRGIADSSFNGSTQSTASVYLGDVQLQYSEQDPDLKLYDMQGVEVMEGPQGTLYGSGAIGGIIRLIPNPVDLTGIAASAAGGVTATQHGAAGYDGQAMLNLPIATDTLGVRLIGYHDHDGGYIDDRARALDDVNAVDTTGGRAMLRWRTDGWTATATGLVQRIVGADSQYADRSVGALARRSALAQPFSSQVGLGSLEIARDWADGMRLASVTSFATYDSRDTFDATVTLPARFRAMPFVNTGIKRLVTQETRLSGRLPGGGSWLVGIAGLRDRDSQNRALGAAEPIGVTNVTRSGSAFAEATLALTARLSITGGARYTLARIDSEPSFRPRGNDFTRGRTTRRTDPTLAASWQLGREVAAFARYQSGYRTGGLAVARNIGRVADYEGDTIKMAEVGMRKLRTGPRGLAFTVSLSRAAWDDIQADLVTRRGVPYTANVGDARVTAVDATADWVPIAGLRATAAMLFTANDVYGPLASASRPAARHLPNTPAFAAHADLAYDWAVSGDARASVGVGVGYAGRSALGIGDALDLVQGNYATASLRGGWRRGGVAVTIDVTNLFDQHANVFAAGNPFEVAGGTLSTPLRPRAVRLGIARAW